MNTLIENGELPDQLRPEPSLFDCKAHSDEHFSCKLAIALAEHTDKTPRSIARLIVAALPSSPYIASAEATETGQIIFLLDPDARLSLPERILQAGDQYGRANPKNIRVLIEPVSIEPTAPLQLQHGRSACYASSLSHILRAAGYSTESEIYVRDSRAPLEKLSVCVWLRYLINGGVEISYPSAGYLGRYVDELAQHLRADRGEELMVQALQMSADIPADEHAGGDSHAHIDALISRAKLLLSQGNLDDIYALALGTLLADIRDDLDQLGVQIDNWLPQSSLTEQGHVESVLKTLESNDQLRTQDNSQYLRASDNNTQEAAVRKANTTTELAADIAYLSHRFERGFDRIVSVLSANQQQQAPQLQSIAEQLQQDSNKLALPTLQAVALRSNELGNPTAEQNAQEMSLRALRREIGTDATRYFLLMYHQQSPIDFDIALAKTKADSNPVYFVQSAYALTWRVFEQLKSKELQHDRQNGSKNRGRLTEILEGALLESLAHYPEVIETAAEKLEPQLITDYLHDLATAFHKYNTTHQILTDDADRRDARLNLCLAVRQTLANALGVIGVSAPTDMQQQTNT